MGLEYRKRCLEYALQQCREDAIVNMTDDEIIAEWGFQRSPFGPLHAAAARIEALESENAEALDILNEFKAEVAKLAESDPDISEADRKRLAHLGAAQRYREMAQMSVRDNASLTNKVKALESRQRVLSEIASNADRAMRFVKLVASQRLSDAANAWYAGEFGEEGEPDFEGAYDSFIEQARCILNDADRDALAGDAG